METMPVPMVTANYSKVSFIVNDITLHVPMTE
jgi:hypothetical protein